MGAMSMWHWLIVLGIVVLVFGTKKLRNLGGDLGGAIKNFKSAVKEGDAEANAELRDLGGSRNVGAESPASDKDKV